MSDISKLQLKQNCFLDFEIWIKKYESNFMYVFFYENSWIFTKLYM